METLMGSCWKIFPPKFGEEDRLIPDDVWLSRKENGFLKNQKRDLLLGFSLSVSFHCKTAIRSVSSVGQENQTLVEREETDQIQVADQPKTAHVRFKLTKKCAFGQHFVIVGDDPCLGLWVPSDGVRFDWADGHIWTAELDVPCSKVIKYKFVLKVDDNTLLWQPGPDRILETWETEKTIIVFEDWDHSEFQDIVEEEEFIADLNDEKSLINSELLTVSEILSQTTQDEWTDAKKQLVGPNEHSSLDDNLKQDSNTCINYPKHEETLVLQQESPVLLPGLIPMLTDETDEESPNEIKDKEDIIEEEEFVADLNDEKSLINSELLTVSKILSQTTEDEGIDVKKRLIGTNEHSSLDDNLKKDSNTCINYSKHEEISFLEQDAPVLLPGLIPMLTDETDEESPNEVKDKEDIVEEEFKADLNDEKSLINSEFLTVSENLSQTIQDEVTDAKRPLVGTNEHSSLDDKVKQDSNTCINYSKHEESSVLEQEAPVLLPGLIPMLTDETDEESSNEVKDKELKIEHNAASLRSAETSKVVMENEKGFDGKEHLEILDGDVQWGRGMVQKFLAILGF